MPSLAAAEVTGNARISDLLFWITFRSPDHARVARPGQFVHVINSDSQDPLLRRPYSLSAIDPDTGTVSVLYHVVGRGSQWLAARRPGDILDTIGPLGTWFTIEKSARHLLMVGGGIGMGPLIALARHAQNAGLECVILNGARTAAGLVANDFIPVAAEFHVATDDGSAGQKGTVVDLVPKWYGWCDQLFACGPVAMLQALDGAVRGLAPGRRTPHKPVQMALEARMACGMGVCYSCVFPTRHGPKRVCTEGPVFDMNDLRWEWGAGA